MNTVIDSDLAVLDRRALEYFVVDNVDLEQLELLLDQFNIFEAIGAVRQELRHSDFLAFLLKPQASHGLGDALVKRLLQRVLASAQELNFPVSPIDFDVWSLNQMTVLREAHNIDILLTDNANKLAIIIENKIDSALHSNQLERYWNDVAEHYKDYNIIGLYLTPDGDDPLNKKYAAVS